MESTAQYWRPVWEALERSLANPSAGRGPVRTLSPAHCILHKRNRIEDAGGRKTRLSRRGASGETLGRAGTDPQFCARRRAAALADRDAPQVPDHAQPRATPQSARVAPRGSAHQDIECRVRSAGHQCASHAATLSATAKRIRPTLAALADSTLAGNARSIARRLRCVRGSSSGVYRRLVKLTLDELRVIEDHLAQLDQQMAAAACAPPRCGATPGRSTRSWRRFRAADHRGSRCQAADISLSETARVLDGRVPGQ